MLSTLLNAALDALDAAQRSRRSIALHWQLQVQLFSLTIRRVHLRQEEKEMPLLWGCDGSECWSKAVVLKQIRFGLTEYPRLVSQDGCCAAQPGQ